MLNELKLSLVFTAFLLIVVGIAITWKRKLPNNRSGLFRFNDGLKNRSIDPIATLLALEGHKELLPYRHPEQARNGNKEAIRICTDAIKDSFGVVAFSDPKLPGLTVAEMLDLLNVFLYYCEIQKKSTNTSETLQAFTEGSTSSESTEPITVSSSVSGSIETAR